MDAPLLFLSAGDPSGDIASARLLQRLLASRPGLTTFGLGGARLAALGQRQLAEPADLAVLGFWEVARRYRFFRHLMNRSVAEIEHMSPACILLVDYPGFNLRLAARVKRLGIPIVYYISPQVWAWAGRRIHRIKELVDRMLLILPFEKELYDSHGIPNELVGHYLVEDIPAQYIASDPPAAGQIALLPGSRRQEIERMLVPMLGAARRHLDAFGGKAVVAGVKNVYDYEKAMAPFAGEPIEIVYDDSRRVLYESDLVVTASGTATLEAGIIGRPMVIIYKTGFVTYQIARRLVTLRLIGLVNLVLGETVVPELIQYDASPDRIASELARYRTDAPYFQRVCERLKTVAGILGGRGASERAAAAVGSYL
ncbi:MAG: lipid-A-disaccharide synthase [candidate division Zixibacteria bacterium]|jgi:lipid-A-disaccharide synthase|nr:lipid-A-disaccharide synthase [candidate division Zixibacteria bacterium]